MKKAGTQKKRRKKLLPLAVLGVLFGVGLGYALVQWRKALMPEAQLMVGPDGPSIYEVDGDATRDWPPAEGEDGARPAGAWRGPVGGQAVAMGASGAGATGADLPWGLDATADYGGGAVEGPFIPQE
jgi:hypothetical protein